ncbi:unnamed protein product [Adineta ricciae]|uniref:Uncharacterized protein n=2 Tax=Adineta ricciae TaxID=249248 RepID=A0A814FYA9_ADIRI|nr:unnamed protein product [Adineta ricciae]
MPRTILSFLVILSTIQLSTIELYHRHTSEYNIYIVSCSNIKTHVEMYCLNTTIKFLDLGSCYNDTELARNLEAIASQTNILLGAMQMFGSAIADYYPHMYDQMLRVLQPEMFHHQKTTIVITDRLTYAGASIADHFQIPYIVNVAGLLPYLGWHDILPSDYNPWILSNQPPSIHSLGINLLARTVFPILRYFLLIQMYFQFDRPFNCIRQEKLLFNHSSHLWSYFNSHLFLVNNAFGLEYAQHIPPNVQITGPMLSMKLSSNDYIEQLSHEDRQWIESDSRPIIYVNFGTAIPLSNEQVQKLSLALKSLSEYRVLWKIDHPGISQTSSSTFRIVKWISSSLGHLAHPAVQIFISHCGINSAYESVWLGTAILCIPRLGDQLDMAQRLEDAGVGKWLNQNKFTPDQLKQTVELMLTSGEMVSRERNIKRIQAIMKLHGGVERAVDLIEMTAEYGIKSFVPVNNSYPWYAYYNLDVYTIWLFILILLKKLIHYLILCNRRTAKSKEKTN